MNGLIRICQKAFVLLLAMTSIALFALPPDFRSVFVAGGFNRPIALQQAPDGRFFTIEQDGKVNVVSPTGVKSTFHNVSTTSNGEDGLLGLALHPDFATNGWVYLYYTSISGNTHNRIVRIQGTTPAANVSTGQETLIYRLDDSGATIHNGGAMCFYKGKLYATSGDNSNSGNAQNLDNVLGKILRLNDDGSAPTDNPFYTTPTARRSYIWAYGFRNPFTMDINQVTGKMFVGNVSEFGAEGIKDIAKGGNYGWPNEPESKGAVYVYGRDVGCALVAGAWYQPVGGSNWPAQYQGVYFFADWCSDWIKYLKPNGMGGWTPSSFQDSGFNESIGWRVGYSDGAMYYFRRDIGTLNKIVYGTGSQPPTLSVEPQGGTFEVGSPFSLSVVACCDALNYQWKKGGALILGATGSTYTVSSSAFTDAGNYSVTVSNSAGNVTSLDAPVIIINPNAPPVAKITLPEAGFLYTTGVPVPFSGTGFDPETGTMPASAFTWRLDFHHQNVNPHIHPGPLVPAGVTSGSFVLPAGDHLGDTSLEPIFYRLVLTVTDNVGKTGTDFVDIYPIPVNISITTTPLAGLDVTVDSIPRTTPFTQVGGKGNDFILGVVPIQTRGNKQYTFSNWSHGGPASQTFTLGSGPYNLVANFIEEEIAAGQLWLEAEAGTLTGGFTISSSTLASGNQYITPPVGINSYDLPGGVAKAAYSFNVVTPGSYKIWGRVLVKSVEDDSFWFKVDNGNWIKWNNIPINANWAWDDLHDSGAGGAAAVFNFNAGLHTLTIGNREDGALLDRIYITSLGDVPSGLGGLPATQFSVVLSVADGVGTTQPGVGVTTKVDQGGSLNISATPASGFVFSHWHIQGGILISPTSASTTLTNVQSNVAIEAHFDPAPIAPIAAEFETMVVAASSGDAKATVADPATSGGNWLKVSTNAANDFMTFSLASVPAGTYRIQVKTKGLPDRGIAQLATAEALGGPFANKDAPKDFYTAGAIGTYNTLTFTDTVTFATAGTKYFRFTVTGKNAGSTNFILPLDALILTPQ